MCISRGNFLRQLYVLPGYIAIMSCVQDTLLLRHVYRIHCYYVMCTGYIAIMSCVQDTLLLRQNLSLLNGIISKMTTLALVILAELTIIGMRLFCMSVPPSPTPPSLSLSHTHTTHSLSQMQTYMTKKLKG